MQPGDVIASRFELEEFVARGGMGDVWRARDRSSGGPVALKVLSAHYPQLVKRLALEARALATLDHPAIVRHVAHETDEERDLYLVMEWLEGITLADRLRVEPLDIDDTLALAARIADGLGAAHVQGMVHRDVKPLNIFLPGCQLEQAKILDFGIVRLSEWQQITATGVGMGTPEYMAPEQARCAKEIGPQADVFALGCVMFRCLTGRPAFRGRRIEAVLAKIAMVDEMPRVTDIVPEVPGPVDRLVAELMAFEPGDRPANGEAAAARVRAVREQLAVGVEPTAQVAPAPPRRALTRQQLEPVSVIFADLAWGDADTVPSEVVRADTPTQVQHAAPAEEPGGADDGDDQTTIVSSLENVQVVRGPSDAARALPAVRRALDSYGARVEVLYNGSIVAMITGGAATKDRAVRAARGALAIRAILPEASIGVATGFAQADERAALGPIIDAAAGLVRPLSRAIWLDTATASQLPPRFHLAGEDAGADHGGRRELVAEHLDVEQPAEAPRKLLGRATPCVGRNRLLRQLEAAYDGTVEDRASEAIVVVGDAGVGKSRLRAELVASLQGRGDPLTVVAAWGDPLRSKAPYGLIGGAVRSHLAIPDGDEGARRNRLREAVRDRVPAGDVDRVVDFLGELIGVRFPEETSARLRAARGDPELMADHIRRAFLDWLAAEARAAPVLLVIDDLQWGDDASVELVAEGLRRCADLPLLVLALGRPGVHDKFPLLGERWNRQEIVLDALRPTDCERLVDEALGDEVDPATKQSLIDRSVGNPFYLEELIRAAALGETERLPGSVIASVQLRIGRLPQGARQVLRAASIYGRRFWPAGVGALIDPETTREEIDDWLGVLEREELVQRIAPTSALAGEPAYAFRHDLTREAAYSSLTDRDRQTGHRLAGHWLEDAGEDDPVVLAEHFAGGGAAEQAVEWFARAAEKAMSEGDKGDEGDETTAMASLVSAGRYLLRAADTAAQSYANDTAVAFYERAIALLAPLDPKEAANVRLRFADVLERTGERDSALGALEDAVAVLGPDAPALRAELLLAQANLWARTQDAGALDRANRVAHEARDLASREGRRDLEAQALAALAMVLSRRGCESDSHKAVQYAERALALRREHGDVASGLWRLGNVFMFRNDLLRARMLYEDALRAADRAGNRLLSAMCRANLGMVEFRAWNIDRALAETNAALDEYTALGHQVRVTEALINLGTFHHVGGDWEAAKPLLQRALARARGDWVSSTLCRECLADIARHEGREQLAQAHLREAASQCGQTGAREKQAHYLGQLAESLWCDGDYTTALVTLERATEIAGATLSHALILVRLAQFSNAAPLLEAFEEAEPDPDRRLLATLGRSRIAIHHGETSRAKELCHEALATVPASLEHYSIPLLLVSACADRNADDALVALDMARLCCGRHIFAELVADVGGLISAREESPRTLARFLALSERVEDRSLRYRVSYLRGMAHRRLGEASQASACFELSRQAANLMLEALPGAYRDAMEQHPWVRATRELRLL